MSDPLFFSGDGGFTFEGFMDQYRSICSSLTIEDQAQYFILYTEGTAYRILSALDFSNLSPSERINRYIETLSNIYGMAKEEAAERFFTRCFDKDNESVEEYGKDTLSLFEKAFGKPENDIIVVSKFWTGLPKSSVFKLIAKEWRARNLTSFQSAIDLVSHKLNNKNIKEEITEPIIQPTVPQNVSHKRKAEDQLKQSPVEQSYQKWVGWGKAQVLQRPSA